MTSSRDSRSRCDSIHTTNFAGSSWAYALAYVLEKCGDDLTRESVMHQATHLKEVRIRFLLPGITLNASPTDYRPVEQFIMHRFDGNQSKMFGDVMQVSAVN